MSKLFSIFLFCSRRIFVVARVGELYSEFSSFLLFAGESYGSV